MSLTSPDLTAAWPWPRQSMPDTLPRQLPPHDRTGEGVPHPSWVAELLTPDAGQMQSTDVYYSHILSLEEEDITQHAR